VVECFLWYQLTRVVPDKIHKAIKRLCVCVTLDVTGENAITYKKGMKISIDEVIKLE